MKISTTILALIVPLCVIARFSKPKFPSLYYLGTINISITAGQQIPVYEGTRVLNSYLGFVCTPSPLACHCSLLETNLFIHISPLFPSLLLYATHNRGNFTDNKGNTIATIIPGEGGEGGLINSKGVFHPSVRGALQFVDLPGQTTYGFFTMAGIKNGTEYLYL